MLLCILAALLCQGLRFAIVKAAGSMRPELHAAWACMKPLEATRTTCMATPPFSANLKRVGGDDSGVTWENKPATPPKRHTLLHTIPLSHKQKKQFVQTRQRESVLGGMRCLPWLCESNQLSSGVTAMLQEAASSVLGWRGMAGMGIAWYTPCQPGRHPAVHVGLTCSMRSNCASLQ